VTDVVDPISQPAAEKKETTAKRVGRRAIMFVGAAAGAGAAVSMVGGAESASADDTALLLGEVNTATNDTQLASSAAEQVLIVTSNVQFGTGVTGIAQLPGGSSSGIGVEGYCDGTGQGVYGTSNGIGVIGVSPSTSGLTQPSVAGVVGDSDGGPGVSGLSSGGAGVEGHSTVENGVSGYTTADNNSGVAGFDQSTGGGYGLYGQSDNGVALWANGVAKFQRSGIASIPAGKSSATVSASPLTDTSLILATPQNSISGLYVQAVIPNVTAGTFKIVLSKAVPSGDAAKVGWFIVN
jgi:hypothetical protein